MGFSVANLGKCATVYNATHELMYECTAIVIIVVILQCVFFMPSLLTRKTEEIN